MAEMLEQTKRAIEGLKAAGFKRGEFKVRTPKRGGYWGRVEISIDAPREKQIAAIPALLEQGFDVTRYYRADGFEYYPSIEDGTGKLTEIRFAEDDTVASYETEPRGACCSA